MDNTHCLMPMDFAIKMGSANDLSIRAFQTTAAIRSQVQYSDDTFNHRCTQVRHAITLITAEVRDYGQ